MASVELIAALTLVVLAIAAGMELAARRIVGPAPDRRSDLPVDARVDGVHGCVSCPLAASGGDDVLRRHVAADHPDRLWIRGGKAVEQRRAA